jgi:tetratricopeptide (TPR) repeat protein
MLETIREYALERLEEAGEAEAVRKRHAAYYLKLVEVAEPHLQRRDQVMWLSRLEADHDNLRAALAWSQTASDGADVGLRLAVALSAFWIVRGYWREGRAWLTRALERGTEASPALLARAQAHAGYLARQQGDLAEASRLADESLSLSRALGDAEGIAVALKIRGSVAYSHNDYEQAHEHFAESLRLFRELGNQDQIAEMLDWFGSMVKRQGDNAQATVLYQEELELWRALGNT